jgi:hypothetical protein
MRVLSRKKVVVLTAVSLTALGAGTAFALWTSTADGPGSSKAITAVNVTVNAQTGTADLYPGASGKVSFTLTNTNPYAITFTSMTPGAVTSSDPTNCPASNVTVAPVTGLSLSVAANATTALQSIPSAVTMISAAPDGCQGVTFTTALTLTGSQS